MAAQRKTNVLHFPKAATNSDRHILTTYYTDSKKALTITTTRSKYPRMAVQRAIDYISMDWFANDEYYAMVAEIYDENTSEHHGTVRKYLDGRVVFTPARDIKDPRFIGTSKDPFGAFIKKKSKSSLIRRKQD